MAELFINGRDMTNKFLIFSSSILFHLSIASFLVIGEVDSGPSYENMVDINISSFASEAKKEEKKVEKVAKSVSLNEAAIVKKVAQEKSEDSVTAISRGEAIKKVPPVYPNRSVELRQHGTVNLHVFLKESGESEIVKIVRSSGFKLLDLAALNAVKKWQFKPLVKNGQRIAGWVHIPIHFVLN